MARPAAIVAALLVILVLGACGSDEIKVADSSPYHRGAVLFDQRCAGCHTLKAAGTHGSASNIRTRERNDGPNFNVRCEDVDRVLYAIRNGGFSGAIMPQNIVVGSDADAVARFVAKYAGQEVHNPPAPGSAGSGSTRSHITGAQQPATSCPGG